MPRPKLVVPSYRHHARTGQAVVTIATVLYVIVSAFGLGMAPEMD